MTRARRLCWEHGDPGPGRERIGRAGPDRISGTTDPVRHGSRPGQPGPERVPTWSVCDLDALALHHCPPPPIRVNNNLSAYGPTSNRNRSGIFHREGGIDALTLKHGVRRRSGESAICRPTGRHRQKSPTTQPGPVATAIGQLAAWQATTPFRSFAVRRCRVTPALWGCSPAAGPPASATTPSVLRDDHQRSKRRGRSTPHNDRRDPRWPATRSPSAPARVTEKRNRADPLCKADPVLTSKLSRPTAGNESGSRPAR